MVDIKSKSKLWHRITCQWESCPNHCTKINIPSKTRRASASTPTSMDISEGTTTKESTRHFNGPYR